MTLAQLIPLLHLPQTPYIIATTTDIAAATAAHETLQKLATYTSKNWKQRKGCAETIRLIAQKQVKNAKNMDDIRKEITIQEDIRDTANNQTGIEMYNEYRQMAKLLATGGEAIGGNDHNGGTSKGLDEETMKMMELAGNQVIQGMHEEDEKTNDSVVHQNANAVKSTPETKVKSEIKLQQNEPLATSVPSATLSAREKMKEKLNKKRKRKTSTDHDETQQPRATLTVQYKEKAKEIVMTQTALEILIIGLESAEWQVRHGACLGLRALLQPYLPTIKQLCPHILSNIARRILMLLARDGFADFTSDEVVAPVRESAAQVLAILLLCMEPKFQHEIILFVQKLADSTVWTEQISGLIALKYLAPALPGFSPSTLFSSITRNDDARSLGATTLLSMTLSDEQRDTIRPLIYTALADTDDMSSSLPVLLKLLIKVGVTSLGSILQFSRHVSPTVRMSVVKILREISVELMPFPEVIRILFQHLLLEEHDEIREASSELVHKLFKNHADRSASIMAYIPSYIYLLAQPLGKSLDLKYFYFPGSKTTNSVPTVYHPAAPFPSAPVWSVPPRAIPPTDAAMVEQDQAQVPLETLWSSRLAAAEALGLMMAVDESGALFSIVLQITQETEWALTRTMFQYTLSIFTSMKKHRMDHQIPPPRIYSEVRPMYSELENHIKQLGRDSNEEMAVFISSKAPHLQPDLEVMETLSTQLQFRVSASAISVILNTIEVMPEKTSHLIQPLLGAIKTETQQRLQLKVAYSLGELLLKLQPKLASKILLNLTSSYCNTAPDTLTEATCRRGTQLTLAYLCNECKEELWTKLSALRDILAQMKSNPSPALRLYSILYAQLRKVSRNAQLELLQQYKADLIDLALELTSDVHSADLADAIFCMLQNGDVEEWSFVLEDIIPLLVKPEAHTRYSIMLFMEKAINEMQEAILPYLVLFLVPIMGRMSDQKEEIRTLATSAFSTLVRLMPLEAETPNPSGISQKLIKEKVRQREFVLQLLDPQKLSAYEIPIKIKAELREYQKEGVNWLAFLHKYRLHGLLCDDMGLGKSLQAICMIASSHHEAISRREKPISIIVCPKTLIYHWTNEIRKFVDTMKPFAYTGSPEQRRSFYPQLRDYDVIVTSYELVRSDVTALKEIRFHYCILDEGHLIRNSKTKLYQAIKCLISENRLILTGTPIQNNTLELWALFDFVMPGFLGTESSFTAKYAKPIQMSRDVKASSALYHAGENAVNALHRQVLPFILRRMKEQVLEDLPPKIIQDHYCALTPLQQYLYEKVKQKSQHMFGEKDSKSSEGGIHVFQMLQYLRKVCNHPLLVLDPKNPADHALITKYHGKNGIGCSLEAAPKLEALYQILDTCGLVLNQSEPFDKDLLKAQEPPHKVLIFCQLKAMVQIVEKDLFQTYVPDIKYLKFDGSTDMLERQRIVDLFNTDPQYSCLLLTTQVGGLGLTLTGADTVVFMEHDWNPMKDLQAMDRAHRIGQKRTVNVYRLIAQGTLEEKIMGLQQFKIGIANTVVSKENSSIKSMDTGSLLDLFNLDAPSKEKPHTQDKLEDIEVENAGLVSDSLVELMEQTNYEEDYNLDDFLQSIKG